MEIELGWREWKNGGLIGLGCLLGLLLLIALYFVGKSVTPVVGGHPDWLTPERWQAARLARLAQAETLELAADLDALATLMDAEMPNPVSAMLLAQAVYAHQRTGTSATATARQAAIVAAEMVARYTAGSADFASAAYALDIAYLRLAPLGSPTTGQSGP